MKDDCPFCFNNRKIFLYENSYDVTNMYFYEDKDFSISPDLSPLVTGHLLVIPHEHFASFGEIDDPLLISRIHQVSADLLKTDDLLYFEHGAVIEGEGGASVDHAHLHIMPRPNGVSMETIDNYIKLSGHVSSEKIEVTEDTLHTFFIKRQPYVYYGISGKEYAYPVSRLPHQFLRMMLQNYCNLSYNWRNTYKLAECRNNVINTIQYVNLANK